MPANTNPLYSLTPNIGTALIATTSAQVKSDGTCAGTGTDLMYCTFIAGANGSYITRVRFNCVASAAATTSVATTLRVYYSTISAAIGAAVGATTNTNTFLLAEISAPAISASHSTNGTNFYEIPLNIAIPTASYIHVSQHVAQTTNQAWNSKVIGGNY